MIIKEQISSLCGFVCDLFYLKVGDRVGPSPASMRIEVRLYRYANEQATTSTHVKSE